MKLFDGGRAPNPRRVRIFLAEKGIEVPTEAVDMGQMAHRSEEMARLNPLKRLPVLELDDGTVLTESIAICRYFEELHPEPPLFGTGALGRARVEMWNRRLELGLYAAVSFAFRHTHPAMADWEVPQIAAWGEANRPKALEFLELFDTHLADNRFAAGEDFSVADITGLIACDFMKPAKIAMPEGLGHVARWYGEVSARPSAAA
ncbi:glutathione S-transferase family protein [Aurantimonas sp. HBX-1]|uniref:glutathione S-transferase family protein n=1 Tax=Aurantimonas sp. HBX-1 TaxID=2906072 RepID=UPI001F4764D1|nr:glutathione S-transferase [Aurantimonas sp. HBX-1]UIJ73225.1 glutathione S-transferase [Aurantimonas sp. HBX-1]